MPMEIRQPLREGQFSHLEDPPTPRQKDLQWTIPLGIQQVLQEGPSAAVASGRITVTTPGTRVQFPNRRIRRVQIKALSANVGAVFIGGSDVTSANGWEPSMTTSTEIWIDNLNRLYLDAATAADGVQWLAV